MVNKYLDSIKHLFLVVIYIALSNVVGDKQQLTMKVSLQVKLMRITYLLSRYAMSALLELFSAGWPQSES